jgi:hypothetical protein
MITKTDAKNVAAFVTGVQAKIGTLIASGDTVTLAALVTDLSAVIQGYTTTAQSLLPTSANGFPKSNIFTQIAWVISNSSWLVALTGSDPFQADRQAAELFASTYQIPGYTG